MGLTITVLPPGLFDAQRLTIIRDAFLQVIGPVQSRHGMMLVRAERIEYLAAVAPATTPSHDSHWKPSVGSAGPSNDTMRPGGEVLAGGSTRPFSSYCEHLRPPLTHAREFRQIAKHRRRILVYSLTEDGMRSLYEIKYLATK